MTPTIDCIIEHKLKARCHDDFDEITKGKVGNFYIGVAKRLLTFIVK